MNENNLRIIKTARTEAAINQAINDGFNALIKPVIPSKEIKSKFSVVRDTATGLIKVIHDFRAVRFNLSDDGSPLDEVVIPFTDYYPYKFESPFAAYLVPSDIVVNERVWLEDLIEDVVGNKWNQGDAYRLSSIEAVWNGNDFEYTAPEIPNTGTFIG